MCGRAHQATCGCLDDLKSARLAVPLLHFRLGELGDLPLVLFELSGDSDHWIAEWVLDGRIEIEEVVLVRQRGLLVVRRVGTICVLLDECFPLRAPAGCHPEGV